MQSYYLISDIATTKQMLSTLTKNRLLADRLCIPQDPPRYRSGMIGHKGDICLFHPNLWPSRFQEDMTRHMFLEEEQLSCWSISRIRSSRFDRCCLVRMRCSFDRMPGSFHWGTIVHRGKFFGIHQKLDYIQFSILLNYKLRWCNCHSFKGILSRTHLKRLMLRSLYFL